MSNKISKLKSTTFAVLVILSIARGAFATPNSKLIKTDIEGVWNLKSFSLDDGKGKVVPWCEGAYGSIVYFKDLMSVTINCKSDPSQMVIYSGPYHIEDNSVVHEVQNYSDEKLHKNLKRKVEMPDSDHLNLVGPFGNTGTVIISWERRERFKETSEALPGVYKLIRSENEFQGKTGVPFCTGVYGNILYTPGGFVSVSLNCAPKKDPNQSEPADAFGRKYFYSGTYTATENQALHMPENGSVVEHLGHVQARAMSMSRDELSLSGMNGSPFIAVWKKHSE